LLRVCKTSSLSLKFNIELPPHQALTSRLWWSSL
jgi:hypothetical protein